VLLPILVALLLPQAAIVPGPQYAAVRASTAAETLKKAAGTARKKKKAATNTKRAVAASKASAIGFTSPLGADALSNDLGGMIDRASRGAKWGVLVVSLSNGDTLFRRNADEQLLPASTMKLFTSSLALERFGTNGRFETEVLRAGAIGTDGVLRGDLVLKGAGDPTLAGRSVDSADEPPMMMLARQVAASGVKRVSGGIIADASAFEDRHVPDGWRTRYLGASYAALSFNENKITVVVRPAGSHAEISFQPAVTGVPVTNEVTVTPGSRGARIRVRQDSTGHFAVSGWIGSLSAAHDYQYVVEAPELFAGGALRAALASAGVIVDGPVRLAKAPIGSPRVAMLASPPLEVIVRQMNGESNNHFAELLFRNAAHSTGVAGSAENGNVLLRRFLYEKANISPASVFAADGSGLSTLDRVTPRAMVGLLGYAQKAVWGAVLEASLPIAGETETLRHRMRYTPAMGNLHAKTGTTNDVASLGGYVTAKNGEKLAFSFIYNGRDRWRAKEAMDAMGATLASFSR
jgi:D-alanyl-D-alanine carboxypeptidase/D-alanyl-D-alanine-endopeptidase (penicillin-binding protein 4)